ncbi:MAG: MFS transporter [Planctomycetota bacterium]|nr:MFS transporter [Planctomycetota bacterium]
MPVALLNYLDRQLLAAMKVSLMNDIPSIGTEENWGFMLGQFKWIYAVMSPIGGYVADRISRRWTICTSLFVWSAVTWWTGHVHTFEQLLAARSLMGISEAFYIPAGLALIADYHTGSTRSRAVGLHQMAIYSGVIAGGDGGYIADSPTLGWRFAFDFCGILGMIYAVPLVFILRDRMTTLRPGNSDAVTSSSLPSYLFNASYLLIVAYLTLRALVVAGFIAAKPVVEHHVVIPWSGDTFMSVPTLILLGGLGMFAAIVAAIGNRLKNGRDSVARTTALTSLSELFSNGSYILLVLYFTLPALAGWVVRDWMPAILSKQYNIGQGKAGVAATLYLQIAAVIGVMVGGYLADRWMQTNIRARIYVSALGMMLIVPAIFGVGSASSLWGSVMFLILFGFGWGLFDCNNMPILSQIVRPQVRATAYGIMNMVSISCGGLGDWGFGVLQDEGITLKAIFGAFAGVAIFSTILVLLIRPRPSLAEEEQSL